MMEPNSPKKPQKPFAMETPEKPKKRAFFMPSDITAIKLANLDQCCCADVPCLSIIKEYCESRYEWFGFNSIKAQSSIHLFSQKTPNLKLNNLIVWYLNGSLK